MVWMHKSNDMDNILRFGTHIGSDSVPTFFLPLMFAAVS